MEVLIVGHREVAHLLPMADCIAVMAEALRTLSQGDAVQSRRTGILQPRHMGTWVDFGGERHA